MILTLLEEERAKPLFLMHDIRIIHIVDVDSFHE
jgi:hypothetical protein